MTEVLARAGWWIIVHTKRLSGGPEMKEAYIVGLGQPDAERAVGQKIGQIDERVEASKQMSDREIAHYKLRHGEVRGPIAEASRLS